MITLQDFKKSKDYLVCVDSDGCAMDTMDIKHFKCFGPCMVDEWGLSKWRKPILARWNELNLYTITRGINRFKGLSLALQEINKQYTKIEDLDTLVRWVGTSKELSNDALKRAICECPDSISLKKALSWSMAVNTSINALPDEEKLPFPLAKEALKYAHERADVAIVSSANLDAVLEEWEKHGLLEHVDIVLAQNAGSKAYCIGELVKKGYELEKVLMCGDAPGDLDAAEKNAVYYYPILVKKEKYSWGRFIDSSFDLLVSGNYGEQQEGFKQEFLKNLGQ
ncbi:MAG: HAD hydrolase-like protein [Clostridia bacterium]|nr:HAD hydrolase-like protein [Clostridia bacterium]